MANVSRPQAQKQDGLGQLMSIGVNAARAYAGDPTGYVGLAQDVGLGASKQAAQAPEVGSGRAAIGRRMESMAPMNPGDYAQPLAQAEQAAQTLPPDMQKQYLPALQKARAMNQGVA